MSNLHEFTCCHFCEKQVMIINMRHGFQPRIKNFVPRGYICITCCHLLGIRDLPYSYENGRTIYVPANLRNRSFAEIKLHFINVKKENKIRDEKN